MTRLHALIIPLLLLSMSACFTGIESTPKITANDVKKERVTVSNEESYLASIKPQPLADWEPGKKFYVTDDKINLALEPNGMPSPKAGEYLIFRESRPTISLTGTNDTELIFIDARGNEVIYRIAATPEETMERSRIDIPFTIEESLVDGIRDKLEGQTLYTRTSTWYNDEGRAFIGLKFVPVKITEVLPGNLVYPIKLRFDNLSSDGQSSGWQYMSVTENAGVSRNFASLFSFKDPHTRYNHITDENWNLIIHGRVAPYMTREECRLALGAPKTVDRRTGISTLRELWTYENGVYLIFDDGILQSFRQ